MFCTLEVFIEIRKYHDYRLCRYIHVKKINCEYRILCKPTKIVVFCVRVQPARSRIGLYLYSNLSELNNFWRIITYRNIFLHHSTAVVSHTLIVWSR